MDDLLQDESPGGAIAPATVRRSLFKRLDRRSADHGALHRALTASEMIMALVGLMGLGAGALAAIGWRSTSPASALAAIGNRVDTNSGRITHLERRVDTLETQQSFTNYLLCVQLRRTDPAAVPPDCAPIFQSRVRP